MKENLSFTDRELRIIFGAASILAVMLIVPSPMGWWSLLALAAVPVIVTAITGWDPLYALLSWQSKKGEQSIQQKHWSFANVGMLDRLVRYATGAAITCSVLMGFGAMATIFFAVPLIVTAVMAWDPIYAMANLNTMASKTDAAVSEDVVEDQAGIFYEFKAVKAANDHEPLIDAA